MLYDYQESFQQENNCSQLQTFHDYLNLILTGEKVIIRQLVCDNPSLTYFIFLKMMIYLYLYPHDPVYHI